MLGRWMRQGRMPIVVIYYHRVADTQPVPWSLTNDQFVAHVDWLQRHFEMISLTEVRQRVDEGCNSRPAVHITFDDGYAENCDRALPLLIEQQIPCTYFVTLENVVTGKPFDHDVRGGQAVTQGQGIDFLAAEVEERHGQAARLWALDDRNPLLRSPVEEVAKRLLGHVDVEIGRE